MNVHRREIATHSQGELHGAQITGVTGAYYTDKEDVRFYLAMENAERWRDAGLPYVVVDGSPGDENGNDWVKDAHELRGAIVVPAEINGIATQRKQAIAHAVRLGASKVISHEPEKTAMVTFADDISSSLENSDIVVIGRTPRAEHSLPPVQRRIEKLAGWILERTHDFPADALSGGRGFSIRGAEVMAEYPADTPGFNNWMYLYTTVLDARAKGIPSEGISVDLLHPPEMTAQETDNPVFDRKRFDQFKLQLDYLLHRSDVEEAHLPLARKVTDTLNGIDSSTTNQEFDARIRGIEAYVSELGYETTNQS